ncbi:Hypothetical_protein [Hexamita inflata]|uniref:Hypothetical_protein n=1 Tax=Hexamita inflata TaxID=28002 RepID=A0AA86PR81_9EUKA|nr:Hypothetical protein HINF_LOCUS27249 [Hexamita inflata]CAI9959802.1 Hypothetical protein HINF_LOCUS47447 [Hexamita inflata]
MSSTDSTKEGILAYLLKSEKTIESIAFYNEEIAIRMLKQVTTIVISHAHFYYCHFSCVHGETQGQTKNHYKNKCKRHVGFDSLSGAGYFDHTCTYCQLCRRAAYFAQRYISE